MAILWPARVDRGRESEKPQRGCTVNLLKKLLVANVAALSLWAVSAQATTDEAVANRIKPVGEVCLKGDECEQALVAAGGAPAAGVAGRSADDIIAKHCNACHGAGILGAPKIGETAAWQERADAQGGLDALLQTSIKGLNAMPPMGTCNDCSEDEMMSAIKKMSGL